jgi:hypothetical protein
MKVEKEFLGALPDMEDPGGWYNYEIEGGGELPRR